MGGGGQVAVKEVSRVSMTELLRYAAMRGGSMDLPSETLQALDVATKHSLAIRKGWHLVGRNNNLVFPPQVPALTLTQTSPPLPRPEHHHHITSFHPTALLHHPPCDKPSQTLRPAYRSSNSLPTQTSPASVILWALIRQRSHKQRVGCGQIVATVLFSAEIVSATCGFVGCSGTGAASPSGRARRCGWGTARRCDPCSAVSLWWLTFPPRFVPPPLSKRHPCPSLC